MTLDNVCSQQATLLFQSLPPFFYNQVWSTNVQDMEMASQLQSCSPTHRLHYCETEVILQHTWGGRSGHQTVYNIEIPDNIQFPNLGLEEAKILEAHYYGFNDQ